MLFKFKEIQELNAMASDTIDVILRKFKII